MMTVQHQTITEPFDISRYPQLKLSHARKGKQLTTCTTCHKPGYKYRSVSRNGLRYGFFVHYNEAPVGVVIRNGKAERFKYRTCWRFGRIYDSMDEAVDNKNTKKSLRKDMIQCPTCQKPWRPGVYVEKKHDNRLRYLVVHSNENGKKVRCYKFTSGQKEIVANAVAALKETHKPKEIHRKINKVTNNKILSDKAKLLRAQEIIRRMREVYEVKIRELRNELDVLANEVPKRGVGRPPKF